MPAAKGLVTVWLHVPPEREEEFNAWYNLQHIAQVVNIPGFTAARRYAADFAPFSQLKAAGFDNPRGVWACGVSTTPPSRGCLQRSHGLLQRNPKSRLVRFGDNLDFFLVHLLQVAFLLLVHRGDISAG